MTFEFQRAHPDDVIPEDQLLRWCDTARAGGEAVAEEAARRRAATVLALAIARCHPADACQIMTAALEDLSAGDPAPGFLGATRHDAQWWADSASPAELEAYATAALRQIERTAFCERARKRIFAALWETFLAEDKRSFIERVDPKGKFRGRAA